MKKWVAGIAAVIVVFGIGTAVMAQDDGVMSFGRMLPFMKQMHPDLSTEQLQDMYKSCHGTGGSSQSQNFNMMGM